MARSAREKMAMIALAKFQQAKRVQQESGLKWTSRNKDSTCPFSAVNWYEGWVLRCSGAQLLSQPRQSASDRLESFVGPPPSRAFYRYELSSGKI
jgi:hypothetical protein